MSSQFEEYVRTAVRYVKLLLRTFGEVILGKAATLYWIGSSIDTAVLCADTRASASTAGSKASTLQLEERFVNRTIVCCLTILFDLCRVLVVIYSEPTNATPALKAFDR